MACQDDMDSLAAACLEASARQPEQLHVSRGRPGTRAPHIQLKGAVSSTLDLLDPCGFTFLAPDTSSYASDLRTHPVAGVRLRALRRQEIADAA